MRRRFYVAVVRGYRTDATSMGKRAPAGLSAHVLDRAYLHRCVASFQSETKGPGFNNRRRIGIEGALSRARTEARRLNAWHRSWT